MTTTYAHALSLLGTKANRPDATKRLDGRATTARKLPDGSIAVRYHATDILTFTPRGGVTVNTGGFRSATTKDKINAYLPSGFPRLWQADSVWTLAGETFMDGDTLSARGKLARRKGRTDEAKRIASTVKRINTFAKLAADAIPLPMPGGGDCLLCQLERGGHDQGRGHLEEHMREGYVVPSLVLSALEATGYSDTIKAAAFGQAPSWVGTARDYVQKAVRRYLKARFGIGGGCFGRLSGGVHGNAEGTGAKPSA